MKGFTNSSSIQLARRIEYLKRSIYNLEQISNNSSSTQNIESAEKLQKLKAELYVEIMEEEKLLADKAANVSFDFLDTDKFKNDIEQLKNQEENLNKKIVQIKAEIIEAKLLNQQEDIKRLEEEQKIVKAKIDQIKKTFRDKIIKGVEQSEISKNPTLVEAEIESDQQVLKLKEQIQQKDPISKFRSVIDAVEDIRNNSSISTKDFQSVIESLRKSDPSGKKLSLEESYNQYSKANSLSEEERRKLNLLTKLRDFSNESDADKGLESFILDFTKKNNSYEIKLDHPALQNVSSTIGKTKKLPDEAFIKSLQEDIAKLDPRCNPLLLTQENFQEGLLRIKPFISSGKALIESTRTGCDSITNSLINSIITKIIALDPKAKVNNSGPNDISKQLQIFDSIFPPVEEELMQLPQLNKLQSKFSEPVEEFLKSLSDLPGADGNEFKGLKLFKTFLKVNAIEKISDLNDSFFTGKSGIEGYKTCFDKLKAINSDLSKAIGEVKNQLELNKEQTVTSDIYKDFSDSVDTNTNARFSSIQSERGKSNSDVKNLVEALSGVQGMGGDIYKACKSFKILMLENNISGRSFDLFKDVSRFDSIENLKPFKNVYQALVTLWGKESGKIKTFDKLCTDSAGITNETDAQKKEKLELIFGELNFDKINIQKDVTDFSLMQEEKTKAENLFTTINRNYSEVQPFAKKILRYVKDNYNKTEIEKVKSSIKVIDPEIAGSVENLILTPVDKRHSNNFVRFIFNPNATNAIARGDIDLVETDPEAIQKKYDENHAKNFSQIQRLNEKIADPSTTAKERSELEKAILGLQRAQENLQRKLDTDLEIAKRTTILKDLLGENNFCDIYHKFKIDLLIGEKSIDDILLEDQYKPIAHVLNNLPGLMVRRAAPKTKQELFEQLGTAFNNFKQKVTSPEDKDLFEKLGTKNSELCVKPDLTYIDASADFLELATLLKNSYPDKKLSSIVTILQEKLINNNFILNENVVDDPEFANFKPFFDKLKTSYTDKAKTSEKLTSFIEEINKISINKVEFSPSEKAAKTAITKQITKDALTSETSATPVQANIAANFFKKLGNVCGDQNKEVAGLLLLKEELLIHGYKNLEDAKAKGAFKEEGNLSKFKDAIDELPLLSRNLKIQEYELSIANCNKAINDIREQISSSGTTTELQEELKALEEFKKKSVEDKNALKTNKGVQENSQDNYDDCVNAVLKKYAEGPFRNLFHQDPVVRKPKKTETSTLPDKISYEKEISHIGSDKIIKLIASFDPRYDGVGSVRKDNFEYGYHKFNECRKLCVNPVDSSKIIINVSNINDAAEREKFLEVINLLKELENGTKTKFKEGQEIDISFINRVLEKTFGEPKKSISQSVLLKAEAVPFFDKDRFIEEVIKESTTTAAAASAAATTSSAAATPVTPVTLVAALAATTTAIPSTTTAAPKVVSKEEIEDFLNSLANLPNTSGNPAVGISLFKCALENNKITDIENAKSARKFAAGELVIFQVVVDKLEQLKNKGLGSTCNEVLSKFKKIDSRFDIPSSSVSELQTGTKDQYKPEQKDGKEVAGTDFASALKELTKIKGSGTNEIGGIRLLKVALKGCGYSSLEQAREAGAFESGAVLQEFAPFTEKLAKLDDKGNLDKALEKLCKKVEEVEKNTVHENFRISPVFNQTVEVEKDKYADFRELFKKIRILDNNTPQTLQGGINALNAEVKKAYGEGGTLEKLLQDKDSKWIVKRKPEKKFFIALEELAKFDKQSGNPDQGFINVKEQLAQINPELVDFDESYKIISEQIKKEQAEINELKKQLQQRKNEVREEINKEGIRNRLTLSADQIEEKVNIVLLHNDQFKELQAKFEKSQEVINTKKYQLNDSLFLVEKDFEKNPKINKLKSDLKVISSEIDTKEKAYVNKVESNVDSKYKKQVEESIKSQLDKRNVKPNKSRIESILESKKREVLLLEQVKKDDPRFKAAYETEDSEFLKNIIKYAENLAGAREFNPKSTNNELDIRRNISSQVTKITEGNEDLKIRANFIFGDISKPESIGKVIEAVDIFKDALNKDKNSPLSENLLEIINAGSADSQKFYSTMFVHAVKSRLSKNEIEQIRKKQNDPEEVTFTKNSMLDIFYEKAIRVGVISAEELEELYKVNEKSTSSTNTFSSSSSNEEEKSAKTLQAFTRGNIARKNFETLKSNAKKGKSDKDSNIIDNIQLTDESDAFNNKVNNLVNNGSITKEIADKLRSSKEDFDKDNVLNPTINNNRSGAANNKANGYNNSSNNNQSGAANNNANDSNNLNSMLPFMMASMASGNNAMMIPLFAAMCGQNSSFNPPLASANLYDIMMPMMMMQMMSNGNNNNNNNQVANLLPLLMMNSGFNSGAQMGGNNMSNTLLPMMMMSGMGGNAFNGFNPMTMAMMGNGNNNSNFNGFNPMMMAMMSMMGNGNNNSNNNGNSNGLNQMMASALLSNWKDNPNLSDEQNKAAREALSIIATGKDGNVSQKNQQGNTLPEKVSSLKTSMEEAKKGQEEFDSLAKSRGMIGPKDDRLINTQKVGTDDGPSGNVLNPRKKREAAKSQVGKSEIDDIKDYLASPEAKGTKAANLIKGLEGDTLSGNIPAIIDDGIVIISYESRENFDNDLAKVKKSPIKNILDKPCVNAISIVESPTVSGDGKSYSIVIANKSSVRKFDISEDKLEELKEEAKLMAAEKAQESGQNVQKIDVQAAMNEILEKKYNIKKNALDDNEQDILVNTCKNIVGVGSYGIPVAMGLPFKTARRNKLREFAGLVQFSDRDEDSVVVEESKGKRPRVTVTYNGNCEEDTYISIGNNCYVKVDGKEGKVEPDKIYYKSGNEEPIAIDVNYDAFDYAAKLLPNALRPNTKLGKVLKQNNHEGLNSEQLKLKEQAIEKAYNDLEVIISKNNTLSFLINGKTHGAEVSVREAIGGTAATILVTASTGGLGGAAVVGGAGLAALGGAAYSATATLTALGSAGAAVGAGKVVYDSNKPDTATRKNPFNKAHDATNLSLAEQIKKQESQGQGK